MGRNAVECTRCKIRGDRVIPKRRKGLALGTADERSFANADEGDDTTDRHHPVEYSRGVV